MIQLTPIGGSIMESGEIIRYMGWVSTLGQMEDNFQGSGGIIICTELGYTNGLTVKNS